MGRGSVWNPGSVSFGEILLINVLYLIVSSMTRNAWFSYGLNLPGTVCRRCSPEGAREDSPKPRIRRNKTCNINKMKMKRKTGIGSGEGFLRKVRAGKETGKGGQGLQETGSVAEDFQNALLLGNAPAEAKGGFGRRASGSPAGTGMSSPSCCFYRKRYVLMTVAP